MIKGACYCEAVTFEISAESLEAYHCHCSICRKVTGSKFNTAAVIDFERFHWTSELDTIRTFRKTPNGFRHDFCSECGCTVPNAYQNNTKFWLPVGLLDNEDNIHIVKHIFVDSKAAWDEIYDHLPQHSHY